MLKRRRYFIKKEKYIDAVIGPQSYHQINNSILKLENKEESINVTEFNVIEKFDTLNSIKNSSSQISSYLTIQEDATSFVNFVCTIYKRTRILRSIEEIVEEANQLVDNGTMEITLLGQNVNAYEFSKKNSQI